MLLLKKFLVTTLLLTGLQAEYYDFGNLNIYRYEIVKYSLIHSVDPFLVAAIIKTSSNGNASLQGKDGDIGLMGIFLSHSSHFGILPETLKNPATNIDIGCRLLKEGVHKTDGSDIQSLIYFRYGSYSQIRVNNSFVIRTLRAKKAYKEMSESLRPSINEILWGKDNGK